MLTASINELSDREVLVAVPAIGKLANMFILNTVAEGTIIILVMVRYTVFLNIPTVCNK